MNILDWFDDTSRNTVFWAFLAAVIAGVAGAGFALVLIHAAHVLVRGAAPHRYLLALPVLVAIFLTAKRFSHHWMTTTVEHALTQQIMSLVNRLRHSELIEIERLQASDIYAAIADARSVAQAATRFMTMVRCMTTIVICWLYLFSLGVFAGFFFLGMLLVMYLVMELYEKLYRSASHDEHRQEAVMFREIAHLFEGHKELRLNQRKNTAFFETALKPSIGGTETLSQKTSVYYSGQVTFQDGVYHIILAGIVFLWSWFYSSAIILSFLTILLFLWPLSTALFQGVPDIAEGVAALERLSVVMKKISGSKKTLQEQAAVPVQERLTEVRALTLQDIRFSYTLPDGTSGFSIGPVSVTLNAGQIYFLTGGNGSGKTTLLNVLTGLYPPSSGRITINGRQVRMNEHPYLVAAVFNDFHLFDRLYGVDPVDPRRVNALLLQMELTKNVRWKDGRFTTVNLSAGQKRRLALVAALMEDKPIYVFDEWAADQAPDFRRYFYEELLPSLKQQGKIILAITHDDHYYHIADRRISMEYGHILET